MKTEVETVLPLAETRRAHELSESGHARGLLGLIFAVFGLNMFLHFIPTPPPAEGPARDFTTALFVSHYLYVIGAVQVAGGVLLLIGRKAPLGLTLLGPVIVNIVCFHAFMAPAGLPMAIVVSLLALFLLWRYRENFAGLVKNTVVSDSPRRAIATGNATGNS